ncbi:PMSR-domain-containing protein [Hypomontagnella monticulosa]|nr:PMSR-domain-containing protein [Hypomontagnella monticulosa]
MAFTMPTFVSRLFRPFTTSGARFGIVPESPDAIPEEYIPPPGAKVATIAAGCYWGVDHLYRRDFLGDPGLYNAIVGFTGGHTENPTYESVCTGKTGHAEAVALYYDPKRLNFEQLIEYFYRMHDPTTKNQQGGDYGSQYRSAIFFQDEEQEKIAREITRKANEQWFDGRIVTEIVPAARFWYAKKGHQLYLLNNPGGYQCPNHAVDKNLPPLK